MIKKMIILILFLIGCGLLFIGGGLYEYDRSKPNQYDGAQNLISECERELKRTQKCVLIAVEDEPESAANVNNNN